jgi:hypothetical protein
VVKSPVDPRAYEELQNKRVQDLAQEFDLIHIHSLLPPFHLAEAISTPAVYTCTGDLLPLHDCFMRLIVLTTSIEFMAAGLR